MAKRLWRMVVREIRLYEVEIEASDLFDAGKKAVGEASNQKVAPKRIDFDPEYTHSRTQELGEPWATCRGWYDMHEPDNLIVVETSYHNSFTKRDIEILRDRITAMGLAVIDSWNGVGTNTVSFRCTGRVGTGPMDKKNLAALLAPRGA